MIPTEDLKDLLELRTADGLCLVFGETIFINRTPVSPNNVITLLDVAGSTSKTTLDNHTWENCLVQIQVRNTNSWGAWEWVNGIKEALTVNRKFETDEFSYQNIQVSSGPFSLGFDDKHRLVLTLTIQLTRRKK